MISLVKRYPFEYSFIKSRRLSDASWTSKNWVVHIFVFIYCIWLWQICLFQAYSTFYYQVDGLMFVQVHPSISNMFICNKIWSWTFLETFSMSAAVTSSATIGSLLWFWFALFLALNFWNSRQNNYQSVMFRKAITITLCPQITSLWRIRYTFIVIHYMKLHRSLVTHSLHFHSFIEFGKLR